jgi:prepilin-type N-terminal cleavage/methylation domain-containing protein
MRQERSLQPRGFTLLEILVSMSIFLLIFLGIYEVFDTSHANYARGVRRVDVQQNARFAMEEMAKRIRLTGYFSENFDADPGNDLANPVTIQLATNNALAVYGDLDNSGPPSRVFLFCLNPDPTPPRSVFRKRSLIGDANALTCSTVGTTAADITMAENVTDLRFSYFDGNSNPIPNPVPAPPYTLTAAQRQTVRMVVITLVATETIPGQLTSQYTLTSSIRLRNL